MRGHRILIDRELRALSDRVIHHELRIRKLERGEAALTDAELAREAFNAYGAAVEWKNVAGNPMPDWNSVGDRVRGAWIAAACRVRALTVGDLEARLAAVEARLS